MKSTTSLKVEMNDGVVRLIKTNPESRYGISLAMLSALEDAFEEIVSRTDIRAVVVDADGPGFHQGAVMVSELRPTLDQLDKRDFRAIVQRGQALGRLIASAPIPVIGIARGGALGGGLELLLRSDFVFALDQAEFSFPEVTLGFVAAWGGTQWGGRMLPFRRAQEMLLLGEPMSGREAAQAGLITRAFATEAELDAHVEKVLRRLMYCSPASFAQTKACIAATWQGPLELGERTELEAEATAMSSGHFVKALAARQRVKC
jgi:enoyl-CoA hydratase/carnithine racemase